MKKLLIPLVLLLVGVGGGVGAGLFLTSGAEAAAEDGHAAAETTHDCPAPDSDHPDSDHADAGDEAETTHAYAKLNNQFVIPVVENEMVAALVVLSLSVEVTEGQTELVFAHEPKLRDAFLQVLFDHANTGGFQGAFTSASNMRGLRDGLRESAQRVIGEIAHDVLIIEIVRQDI